ncbi:MAG: restriction endonuclease [Oscillospiraceae bacterium]|nr:restriction endonuclease [Oscillospiraceae bacterium]
MSIRLQTFSYRFAEQVLNGKFYIKQELTDIIYAATTDLSVLSRPQFNEILRDQFVTKGWIDQPQVFTEHDDAYARFDYLKDRVGVEVQLGHSSFVGIDLLKFQIASYANLDTIDFGVYIVTTKALQKHLKQQYHLKWEGSLTFEKVKRYLPYIRSAIQVPVYVIGIDY